jgi:LPXTG-motif cell wall-anchored protein
VRTTRSTLSWPGSAPRKLLQAFGVGLAVAALLAAAWPALAQQAVTARLSPQGGSGVGGTATLAAAGDVAHAPRLDDATRVVLEVSGLPPGASAQGSLHAGTCAAPGASAALLPGLTADATGRAAASGFALFRGAESVAFSTVADGDHIVSVAAGGRVVACGAIPRAAGGPSRLPATGSAPGLSPLLGAAGLLLAAAGAARRRPRSGAGRLAPNLSNLSHGR